MEDSGSFGKPSAATEFWHNASSYVFLRHAQPCRELRGFHCCPAQSERSAQRRGGCEWTHIVTNPGINDLPGKPDRRNVGHTEHGRNLGKDFDLVAHALVEHGQGYLIAHDVYKI